jgi:hypothetical protein
MKSPSLDTLYHKIDKHILLAEAYTEIKNLSFIIRTCRLKPYSYVYEKRDKKIVLYKWWFDEFGNSLKIDNKKFKIISNDLTLNKDYITSTDLYYGLSLDKIVKMSKMCYIISGKDEDYTPYHIISFLGIDNYLRCYCYLNEEWVKVSPLLLGQAVLQTIADNLELKYFLDFDGIKNNLLPYPITNQWLTCLPANEHLLEILQKDHQVILNLLDKNRKNNYG